MPKVKQRRWTKDELGRLCRVAEDPDWERAAVEFPVVRRGKWSKAEDAALIAAIQKHGLKTPWRVLSTYVAGRGPKRCCERWTNHLAPGIQKTGWTHAEDQIIAEHQRRLGNKWAAIARFLSGRPPNSVKNRWYAHIQPRSAKPEIPEPEIPEPVADPMIDAFDFSKPLLWD